MAKTVFSSSPPAVTDVLVSFPVPHVLLVTLNRPGQLNALRRAQHAALDRLFHWYDAEPSLRCAVITGTGRAFCAGADLKEWNERNAEKEAAMSTESSSSPSTASWAGSGFGGLSNRAGKKPVVAAVNGLCLGGGMEMAVNCDLVVAAASARFGLPEVARGVVAIAGALPRIVRTLGRQRAAEMALTGRAFSAAEMGRWGLVNRVVSEAADVVPVALELAQAVAANSPDAVIVSREGLRLGWESVGPQLGTELLERGLYGQIDRASNMREGLLSFVEKRAPVWTDSKL
ncbi:enoyl-hydratase [Grosmannia clavigera kw1407]|uniref:Enoyl-hydratase n=1 Tax=Grosmannia clavigera (strain kw1407 / UAMH 11150) TaxID=655863 RepID=F0XAQ6_GROCL|nr:enoyl-hydratase [Grosmannia clavigera kw1407]EFX05824.1 enoyl-hydratase [Grosmannia clavigera kw1407]